MATPDQTVGHLLALGPLALLHMLMAVPKSLALTGKLTKQELADVWGIVGLLFQIPHGTVMAAWSTAWAEQRMLVSTFQLLGVAVRTLEPIVPVMSIEATSDYRAYHTVFLAISNGLIPLFTGKLPDPVAASVTTKAARLVVDTDLLPCLHRLMLAATQGEAERARCLTTAAAGGRRRVTEPEFDEQTERTELLGLTSHLVLALVGLACGPRRDVYVRLGLQRALERSGVVGRLARSVMAVTSATAEAAAAMAVGPGTGRGNGASGQAGAPQPLAAQRRAVQRLTCDLTSLVNVLWESRLEFVDASGASDREQCGWAERLLADPCLQHFLLVHALTQIGAADGGTAAGLPAGALLPVIEADVLEAPGGGGVGSSSVRGAVMPCGDASRRTGSGGGTSGQQPLPLFTDCMYVAVELWLLGRPADTGGGGGKGGSRSVVVPKGIVSKRCGGVGSGSVGDGFESGRGGQSGRLVQPPVSVAALEALCVRLADVCVGSVDAELRAAAGRSSGASGTGNPTASFSIKSGSSSGDSSGGSGGGGGGAVGLRRLFMARGSLLMAARALMCAFYSRLGEHVLRFGHVRVGEGPPPDTRVLWAPLVRAVHTALDAAAAAAVAAVQVGGDGSAGSRKVGSSGSGSANIGIQALNSLVAAVARASAGGGDMAAAVAAAAAMAPDWGGGGGSDGEDEGTVTLRFLKALMSPACMRLPPLLKGQRALATLPERPSRAQSAALNSGYVPCLERMLRTANRSGSSSSSSGYFEVLTASFCEFALLAPAFTYGRPSDVAALMATGAKVVGRLAATVVAVARSTASSCSTAAAAAVAAKLNEHMEVAGDWSTRRKMLRMNLMTDLLGWLIDSLYLEAGGGGGGVTSASSVAVAATAATAGWVPLQRAEVPRWWQQQQQQQGEGPARGEARGAAAPALDRTPDLLHCIDKDSCSNGAVGSGGVGTSFRLSPPARQLLTLTSFTAARWLPVLSAAARDLCAAAGRITAAAAVAAASGHSPPSGSRPAAAGAGNDQADKYEGKDADARTAVAAAYVVLQWAGPLVHAYLLCADAAACTTTTTSQPRATTAAAAATSSSTATTSRTSATETTAAAAAEAAAVGAASWRRLLLDDVDLPGLCAAVLRLMLPNPPLATPFDLSWTTHALAHLAVAFPAEMQRTLGVLTFPIAHPIATKLTGISLCLTVDGALANLMGPKGFNKWEKELSMLKRVLASGRLASGDRALLLGGCGGCGGKVLDPAWALRLGGLLPPPCVASRLVGLEACGEPGCDNLAGDSEAAVAAQLHRCGGRCGGVVSYCCGEHQKSHWKAGHKRECGVRAVT